VASSYYREPSLGKKGNAPTLTTFHQTKGFVEQSVVVNSIDYSDESEHPIPTKVDSRFDDDFLG
jgi:hypothetical protein